MADGVEPTGKDKDNLSYSNVILQITDGEAAGYEPREIVSAVVRATTDPSLRDFLVEQVMGAGLNLDGLKEVLGTHFSVQNATGLYKVMLRRSQREGETAQRFVQEMMKLRDQVYRLSQQEGGFYTADLMQDVFQKGVYNGLRSSSVRQALRLTLRRNDLNDFDLRQEISELMLDEADHETLVGVGDDKPASKTSKSAAVAVKSVSSKKSKTPVDPVVASVVQKLDDFKIGVTKDLADFKQDMLSQLAPAAPAAANQPAVSNSGRGGLSGRGGFRGGRGGRGGGRGGNNSHPLRRPLGVCQICADANALFCNHCLICGNVDHMSYYCPERDNPAFAKN